MMILQECRAIRLAIVAWSLSAMTMSPTASKAADLVVISTTAAKEALIELVPMFERASGHKVDITYGGGGSIAGRIRSGALAGDLFIGPEEFSDPLLAEGKLIAGSRVAFAHSGSSVAVRAGEPRPEIGTPELFKRALLAAKSVSYSTGASGMQVVRALASLGIAEQVKAKHVAPQPGELVGSAVARGAAEIGIQQLSELLHVAGIDILGPLPGALQKVIVYGATGMFGARQLEAAQAFARFLRSPEAGPVIKRKGMDPV